MLKKLLAICTLVVLVASACRPLIYNLPNIDDYKIFPYREISHSPTSKFHFSRAENTSLLGESIYTNYYYLSPEVKSLSNFVDNSKTAAFLIIRNASILYEKYNKDYSEESIFNISSVTKVIVVTLLGIAIDDGLRGSRSEI